MIIEAMMIAEKNGFGIRTSVIVGYSIYLQKGVIPLSKACTNIDAYIRATDYLLLVGFCFNCHHFIGTKEQYL